jgi:hypothetical protein
VRSTRAAEAVAELGSLADIAHGPSQQRNTQDQRRRRGISLGDTKETDVLPGCLRDADDVRCPVRSGTTDRATCDDDGSTPGQLVAEAFSLCPTFAGRRGHTPGPQGRVAARVSGISIYVEIRRFALPTKRFSQPEPAGWPRAESNATGGWLRWLTLSLGAIWKYFQ